MCVCVCVCLSAFVCLSVCVIFFKDFSGTTTRRILKFDTDIQFAVYKTESASTSSSFPLFVHFSFSLIKFFIKNFSGTAATRILLMTSCIV